MKRRIVSLVMAVMMVLALVPTAALAAEAPVPAAVETQAPTNAQLALLEAMVQSANYTIDSLVRIAKWTPYNDVPMLLVAIDCVVNPVFAYARYIGAEVVCDYVEMQIDGQTVLIDPLRVVHV